MGVEAVALTLTVTMLLGMLDGLVEIARNDQVPTPKVPRFCDGMGALPSVIVVVKPVTHGFQVVPVE